MMPSFPFIGHDAIYRMLCDLRAQDRIGSSLLFSGPDGIGKKSLARYWMTSFLCTSPHAADGLIFPCGECSACVQMASGSSADFLGIEPDNGHIAIQKIRDLKAWAVLSSLYGRKKFAIIDEAHLLNRAAANALLKLLEEPNPDLVLALVSAQPSRLLPTIRSRTLSLRFEALRWTQAAAALVQEKRPKTAPALAERWFAILGGAIGTLVSFPIDEWEDLRRDLVTQLMVPSTSSLQNQAPMLEKLKAVKARIGFVFDLIASFLKDKWMAMDDNKDKESWSWSQLWAREKLLAEARLAYREVLNFDLFWEDFFLQWGNAGKT